MPKTVYTLGDLKELLANICGVEIDDVKERVDLQAMFSGEKGFEKVDNDSEIFEIEID